MSGDGHGTVGLSSPLLLTPTLAEAVAATPALCFVSDFRANCVTSTTLQPAQRDKVIGWLTEQLRATEQQAYCVELVSLILWGALLALHMPVGFAWQLADTEYLISTTAKNLIAQLGENCLGKRRLQKLHSDWKRVKEVLSAPEDALWWLICAMAVKDTRLSRRKVEALASPACRDHWQRLSHQDRHTLWSRALSCSGGEAITSFIAG